MIKYLVKQMKNDKSSVNGKFFAYPAIEETVTLEGLAQHMSEHHTPYSQGTIVGILKDMTTCIKEILLSGRNVKIPDLAIFSVGIKNRKGGAASAEDFTASGNIDGVKLRSRATGTLTGKSLDINAVLKRATLTTKPTSSGDGEGDGDNG